MIEPKKIHDIKIVAIYSAMGIGAATGLFLLGRHVYKNILQNAARKDSLEEGDPSTFATQLKMAFENNNYLGWGTNWNLVKQVFQEIPSKSMYGKVQKKYSQLYSSSLNADLEDELSSEEYNELIRILNDKK